MAGHHRIRTGELGPSPWTAGYDIASFSGSIPDMVKAAGGRIWSSHHQEMTAENVKQAHDLGLEVLGLAVKVWAGNDTDRMEALINMSVDGIITDCPDRLRQVLEKLGMPMPLPSPVSP